MKISLLFHLYKLSKLESIISLITTVFQSKSRRVGIVIRQLAYPFPVDPEVFLMAISYNQKQHLKGSAQPAPLPQLPHPYRVNS